MFWLWTLKERLLTYLIALTDPRTPGVGKLFAVLSIVYLLSPIDGLIDTIPLAGFIDDLIIVPFGLWISSKTIPKDVLLDAAERAKKYNGKLNFVVGGLLTLITIWILVVVGLLYFLIRTLFF